MTEKELKKQSRTELLELLLLQTKESERLKAQLEKTQQQLADRQLQVQEAGNLANAVIAVNGVLEAAQAAAQQYLENVEKMEAQTRLRCEKMLEEAQKKAGRIQAEAEQLLTEAERVRAEADQIREEAEQLRSEVKSVAASELKIPSADDQMMEEFYKLIRE